MQSICIQLLGILSLFAFGNAVPLDVTQQNDDAETRIIIPPELPPLHFELLKEKSEIQANCSKNKEDDSTPLNFLRASEVAVQNISSLSQQPIVAFEGSKSMPIYITIPIYINTGFPTPQIVDKEADIPEPALKNVPIVSKENAVPSNDRNKIFTKLLRNAYRQRNEQRNYRNKKRVNRFKPYIVYRD